MADRTSASIDVAAWSRTMSMIVPFTCAAEKAIIDSALKNLKKRVEG